MPSREFFEAWPLYRWMKLDRAYPRLGGLPRPTPRLPCAVCGAEHPFAMSNDYRDGIGTHNASLQGSVLHAIFLCSGCRREEHHFFLRLSDDFRSAMKIGQSPEARLADDPILERALGAHARLYRSGRACEASAQGIGAFWYYRRLAEEILVPLLAEVRHLVDEFRLPEFDAAVSRLRDSDHPVDELDSISPLLPSLLRPKRIDLLGLLAAELGGASERLGDDVCLERASRARAILAFLLKQVEKSRHDAESFAADIGRLLAVSEFEATHESSAPARLPA